MPSEKECSYRLMLVRGGLWLVASDWSECDLRRYSGDRYRWLKGRAYSYKDWLSKLDASAAIARAGLMPR